MPTKPDRANVTLDRTLHKPLKFLVLARDSTLEAMLDQAVRELLAANQPPSMVGYATPGKPIPPADHTIIAAPAAPKPKPAAKAPAPAPRPDPAAPPKMLEPDEMNFDPNRPKKPGVQRRSGASPMLSNLVGHAQRGPTDAERKKGILGTVHIEGPI